MNQKTSLILAIILLAITITISMFPERSIELNCEDDLCLINLAKENNDKKFCELSSNTSKCFYFLALYTNEPKLCELEINPKKCLKSYAISKGNKDICLQFENDEQFDCIFSYAINRGDLEACNTMDDSSFCIYSYVLYYEDPLLCTLTGEYQSDCRLYFEKNG